VPAVWTDGPAAPRVLIAGVGYHHLRDMSFGPLLVERLSAIEWPPGVEIEDLSYGPVGIMHNLDARDPYDRMIFVAGVKRGREAGTMHSYRWNGALPDPEEIQARVAEAVTGVISLDNLLIIATYFGKLPRDVVVIEVEAEDEGWGEGLTPVVEEAIPRVLEEVRRQTAGARTLVAGFGNLLLGDDGFGVRVIQRLSGMDLPGSVKACEIGAGGINLVLTLMEDFSRLIVVDAVRQGRPPGTLCVFTPKENGHHAHGGATADPHFAEPLRAMELARALELLPESVTVVGCEPESCELTLELSSPVAEAVDRAAAKIFEMVSEEGR